MKLSRWRAQSNNFAGSVVGGGGVAHGPTVQIASVPATLTLAHGVTGSALAGTAEDVSAVATGARKYWHSSDLTIVTVDADTGVPTGVAAGSATITVNFVAPVTTDEPNFASGFTLIDSDDLQAYSDITYMGDPARMGEPGQTFVPYPSRALVPVDVKPDWTSVVTQDGQQTLRLRYPGGVSGNVDSSFYRKSDVTAAMADESYVQIWAKLSTEDAVPVPHSFAIKWIIWFLSPRGGGFRRQTGTHDDAPWHYSPSESGTPTSTNHGTWWQTYTNGAFTDEYDAYASGGHDQGTQALGPHINDLWNDGLVHRFTHGFKDMTPGTGTVSIVSGAATFSASQSLQVGDRIRIDSHDETTPGAARVVASISDATHCTLTSTGDSTDVTNSLFAINGGGAFNRMWIDGVKIIDVCQANVGVIPAGGDKRWCGQAIVDSFMVGGSGRNTTTLVFGSSQTEGAEIAHRIDLYNYKAYSRAAP